MAELISSLLKNNVITRKKHCFVNNKSCYINIAAPIFF